MSDDIPADVFSVVADDTPLDSSDSSDGFTCPECNKTVDTERGLKIHLSRVHGSSDKADAKPRSIGVRKANLERQLVEFFTLVGMTVGFFNEYDGLIITQRAEQLGHAWSNLCKQNKHVEGFVTSLLQTSAVGEVLMATAMTAIPIMMNHEMIPANRFFGAPMQAPPDDVG
jgi:hypothetical protein